MPDSSQRDSLMRNLGRFVGHIVQGVRVGGSVPHEPRVVSDHTAEAHSTDAHGRTVVLRRRVIEEVEIRDQPRDA